MTIYYLILWFQTCVTFPTLHIRVVKREEGTKVVCRCSMSKVVGIKRVEAELMGVGGRGDSLHCGGSITAHM